METSTSFDSFVALAEKLTELYKNAQILEVRAKRKKQHVEVTFLIFRFLTLDAGGPSFKRSGEGDLQGSNTRCVLST